MPLKHRAKRLLAQNEMSALVAYLKKSISATQNGKKAENPARSSDMSESRVSQSQRTMHYAEYVIIPANFPDEEVKITLAFGLYL